MAINGKAWAGVRTRRYQYGVGIVTSMIIISTSGYTYDDVIAYYPELASDSWHTNTRNALKSTYLTNHYSGISYEEAMLDSAVYVNTDTSIANYYMACDAGGIWRTDDIYSGAPSSIWAQYPSNPTLAATTVTPFGAYGNGTIHYQFLRSGTDHTAYSDSPIPTTEQYYAAAWDTVFFFMPTDDGLGGGTPDPAPETPPTTDDNVNLRCWSFSLDGHDFYALRIGTSETLVYDLTTDKWASWASPEQDKWRAHVGQNWVGMDATTMARGFGSDVVAGDDVTGTLWVLDPNQGADDNPTTGSSLFDRTVTGGIMLSGRNTMPCGAVTLDLAVGTPVVDGYSIQLEISDDLGKSWLSCGTVPVATDANDAVVEWRGLGTMSAPGRVFRITDSGATSRIGALNLR